MCLKIQHISLSFISIAKHSYALTRNRHMVDYELLDRFESQLTDEMLRLATSRMLLDGTLLSSEDIDYRWHELAPEYMADAIKEISEYPTVSVAWAGYIGMAIANGWDKDWSSTQKATYQSFYGNDGFDDMDEHILRDILGLQLESDTAQWIEKAIRICAQTAVSRIRHENIEPQSPMAFHVFARAVKTMYRIGAAIELKRLGYKFEKVNLPEC